MDKKRFISLLGVALMMGGLMGCACPPKDPVALQAYQENNDPFEPTNRAIFGFNQVVDDYVLTPLVKGYRAVVPEGIRTGILNFVDNLKAPLYAGNSLLQGDGHNALEQTKKFTFNTLFGFFGFFRPSDTAGIVAETADFGQTLGKYGVGEGPYLVLPVIGPSNVRDTAGMVVDAVAMPSDFALKEVDPTLPYVRSGVDGFARRASADALLQSLKDSSTDYYATLRSMYRQNRNKKIGKDGADAYEYDFDFEDED